jgi:UDP-N-acetylmuramate--alanine ligase
VSRTKVLLDDFAKSFVLSDSLFLLEIYTSAREQGGGLSSVDLLNKVKQYNLEKNKKQELKYFKDMKLVEKELKKVAGADNVILLMGAGDVFRIAYSLLKINSSNI